MRIWGNFSKNFFGLYGLICCSYDAFLNMPGQGRSVFLPNKSASLNGSAGGFVRQFAIDRTSTVRDRPMQHLHDMKSVADKDRIRKILPDRFRIRRRQIRGSAFDLLFSTSEFLPKFTQRIRSAPLSDMQDPSGKVHASIAIQRTFSTAAFPNGVTNVITLPNRDVF